MAARHAAEVLRYSRIDKKVDISAVHGGGPRKEKTLEERGVDGAEHGEGSLHLPGMGPPWTLGAEGRWIQGRYPLCDSGSFASR